MKKTGFLLSFLFLILIANIQSQGFQFEFDQDDLICKEMARAEFQMNLAHSRNYAADQTDIYYQVMRWEIDPAVNYIKGVITYNFKSRVDNLSQLILDLANSHTINYIRRGNQ